jgi:hypothetical protein
VGGIGRVDGTEACVLVAVLADLDSSNPMGQ